MQKQGIMVYCFKGLALLTLAKGGLLDPVLNRIVKVHGVSESQVLLRWYEKNGVAAVTMIMKDERFADYIKAPSLQLTDEEAEEISSIGKICHFRQFTKDKFAEDDRS
jgi:diketogulonate reductase-like aldo/keto reductase